MTVRPAHRRLDREVQTVEPDVERHLDTAEDRGFYIIERDLEAGDGVGTHAASLRRSRSAAQCHGNSAARSVIGNPTEHIGELGSRIDIVELGRVNQRVHGGRPVSAAF